MPEVAKYRISQESEDGPVRARALAVWLRNVENEPRFLERYRWYFEESPFAATVFVLNSEGGTDIGAAAISSRCIAVVGHAVSAGVCSDLFLDKRARTLGPAVKLQKEVLREGLKRQRFLYGFPNANARAVMLRAGFSLLGDFISYTRVLRASAVLRNKKLGEALCFIARGLDPLLYVWSWLRDTGESKRYRLHEVNDPDSRLDFLWRRSKRPADVVWRRDAGAVRWRFGGESTRRLTFLALTEKPESEWLGYCVVKKRPDRYWEVLDFFVDGAKVKLGMLFRSLVRYGYREGCGALTLRFLGSEAVRGELSAGGFRERSRDKCAVVGVGTNDPQRALLVDGEKWYLTMADEDLAHHLS